MRRCKCDQRPITHRQICFVVGVVSVEQRSNQIPGSPPETEAEKQDPTGTGREWSARLTHEKRQGCCVPCSRLVRPLSKVLNGRCPLSLRTQIGGQKLCKNEQVQHYSQVTKSRVSETHFLNSRHRHIVSILYSNCTLLYKYTQHCIVLHSKQATHPKHTHTPKLRFSLQA